MELEGCPDRNRIGIDRNRIGIDGIKYQGGIKNQVEQDGIEMKSGQNRDGIKVGSESRQNQGGIKDQGGIKVELGSRWNQDGIKWDWNQGGIKWNWNQGGIKWNQGGIRAKKVLKFVYTSYIN